MTGKPLSVIKLRDVLLVTMPPDPDDATVTAMQRSVLEAMESLSAKGLVLDLSAVDTLDSFFARTVAATAQMVRLMGGRTAIAGMRPSVAITATQLGLDMGAVVTALDVDRALDRIRAAPPGKTA